LGQPDESRVRKACNRSREAVVIGYGGQATETWWKKHANAFGRHRNLRVIELESQASEALGALIQRGMRLDVIIQDGEVQMLADHGSVTLTPMVRQAPAE
ncbi:YaeQ family protein, partial [Xanthomonas fragariae]